MKDNIITLSYLTILILFSVLTIYKVESKTTYKKYVVLEKEIFDAYKKCIIEENCESETTIKHLKDKNYLNKLIDPKTTLEVDENLCLKYENNKIEYCSDKLM